MATNNYYGFAHGGTQYGNQYQPPAGAPTGYNPAQYPAPPGSAAPPQGYAAPGAAPDQYVLSGYTRPVGQVGVQAAQPQQQYYGQPGTPQYSGISANSQKAPTAPAAPRAAATSTVYPTYAANTPGNAATTYAGFAQPAPTAAAGGGGAGAGKQFTNYDQAVYNAVSAYAQGSSGRPANSGGLGYKRPAVNKMKGPRQPPKPQALHYCDVCKISCAGPQTYKEHLEGQKHKKKEAAAKSGTPVVAKGSPPGLRCELCDVTCTGNDAYAAHIRGAKHQKVLKLHTKLGKPIPSDNPTVVTSSGVAGTLSTPNSNKSVVVNNSPPVTASVVNAANKSTPPKINFIGPKTDFSFGSQLVAATTTSQDFSTPVPGIVSTPATLTAPAMSTTVNVPAADNISKEALLLEKDIQPVGQDYIEEVKSDDGKIVSFNCKLCECRFNDPNAKEMHMKGRRHRLQYKKKVNPDLVVDVKPSSRQKKLEDRRSRTNTTTAARRSHMAPPEGFPRCPPVPLLPPGGPRGFGPPAYHNGPVPPYFIPPLMRRTDTLEDAHVMAKHSEIYPDEDELQAIQKIVSNTEKALKCVSDQLAETDAKLANGAKASQEDGSTEPPVSTEADLQTHRILKGVMRVGHLAKGLLLKGDRIVELVVLCSEKPTLAMLNRVMDVLPEQLKGVASEETYEVLRDISGSCVVVASTQEPKIEVTVTLTSPLLRGPPPGEATTIQLKDDPDLLDKEKCLGALAALRHAKWFQARVTSLQSCVILIRIFRDICGRVPDWASFPCWAIELLTEKVISSIGGPVSPGDGLRFILEAISSGILLKNSLGLMDPCEKEPTDVLRFMTDQQRNDVTAFAQRALRLLTFRKINEILGMELLPRYHKKNILENSRKRRRNESAGGEGEDADAAVADGKKDKKEDQDEEMISQVEDLVESNLPQVPSVKIEIE